MSEQQQQTGNMQQDRNNQGKHEKHGHEKHEGGGVNLDDVKPLSGKVALVVVFVGFAVAVVLAVLVLVPRLHAKKELQNTTNELAPPDVQVAKPKMGATDEEIQLPGALQAYEDSPVYARTSGYLAHWYFDIGAHVKEGQLLGVISSPEVDQQLAQARADLASTQATAGNAKVQADRYKGLVGEAAVSQQDTDTMVTTQNSTNNQVQAAQANVGHYEQLVGFEKVYAPFTGVVTARDIDNGQLITAASQELFHMQQLSVLRVYVAVPEIYSVSTRRGVHADLTLVEFPGQHFDGVVVRTANSIDPTTRTLLVEVDVKNPKGTLLPGSYAQVHFKLPAPVKTIVVPVPALMFRAEGLRVALLEPGNKVKLQRITIGKDDGDTVQVIDGLTADDQVVQNPPDSVVDGEAVHPVQPKGQNPDANQGEGGGKENKSGGGK